MRLTDARGMLGERAQHFVAELSYADAGVLWSLLAVAALTGAAALVLAWVARVDRAGALRTVTSSAGTAVLLLGVYAGGEVVAEGVNGATMTGAALVLSLAGTIGLAGRWGATGEADAGRSSGEGAHAGLADHVTPSASENRLAA